MKYFQSHEDECRNVEKRNNQYEKSYSLRGYEKQNNYDKSYSVNFESKEDTHEPIIKHFKDENN